MNALGLDVARGPYPPQHVDPVDDEAGEDGEGQQREQQDLGRGGGR